jgi:hypothetical protein
MRDYIQSLPFLSSEDQGFLQRSLERFENSYERKQSFKACVDRHRVYIEEGRRLPFTQEEFERSFRAKDFWKNLEDCGSWLEFRKYISVDKVKLHTANFCRKDRLCPACAVRRAYKQHQKFEKIIQEYPELLENEWFYIVIPVQHKISDSFEVVWNRAQKVLQAIRQSINNSRKRGYASNIFGLFLGGMYAIETTYTANGWNIHINFLINAPKGFLWPSDLNIYRKGNRIHYQAKEIEEFISRVVPGSYVHSISHLSMTDPEDRKSNLVEILKYSLKFSSLTDQRLLEFYIDTYRRRLFGTFGNLYGLGIDDVELEGDEVLSGDFVEMIFIRAGGEYRLHQVNERRNEDD